MDAQEVRTQFLLRIMLVETGETTRRDTHSFDPTFASSITDKPLPTGFGKIKIFNIMAKSAKTNANVVANNEVVNQSSTANALKGTTLRVVETRDMWAVVFNHTATLLAMAVKGEAFGKDENEGFAFGKTTDKDGKPQKLATKLQPNIRPYSYSLLAGFASRKGYKHAKGTALGTLDLEEVAKTVFTSLHPSGDFDKLVGKAEPKQAKSLVQAVITLL